MLRYLLILLMTMSSFAVNAHIPEEKGNRRFDPIKFEQRLEQYVLGKMNLTQKERDVFLPLFRQKRKAEVTIMDNGRKQRRQRPVTEKEWAQAIRAFDNDEVKLKKVQQTYHEKMLKVLPASKVMDMIRAEEDFHRETFSKMQMHMKKHKKQ